MARYQQSLAREAVEEYAKVAQQFGLTPTQLALAWCKSRWFVASTIIGATTMDQLKVGAAQQHASLGVGGLWWGRVVWLLERRVRKWMGGCGRLCPRYWPTTSLGSLWACKRPQHELQKAAVCLALHVAGTGEAECAPACATNPSPTATLQVL